VIARRVDEQGWSLRSAAEAAGEGSSSFMRSGTMPMAGVWSEPQELSPPDKHEVVRGCSRLIVGRYSPLLPLARALA